MKPLAALALLLLATGPSLAGCTAQHGAPATSAKPVSSAPHILSAEGSSENTVTVPAGAKSAEIAVTCGSSDGAPVSISTDGQDQPRAATCRSTTRFRIAVDRAIHLSIEFDQGSGRSVAVVRFFAEPFVPDPKVATQCTGASAALSDTATAVNGYGSGDVDLAGWQKLMKSAGDKFDVVDRSGAVGSQLQALSDWYGGTDLTPAHPTSDEANEAMQIVNHLCLDNGTPLVILSQYGG